MDRITRKELKTDKFAQEVGNTVEYVTGHRRQLIRYGIAAGVLIVVTLGGFSYFSHQKALRQTALQNALIVQEGAVGPAPNEFTLSFPTEAAKDQAMVKAFTDVVNRYPSSDEGMIARYYLGLTAADEGMFSEAEKWLKAVATDASANEASLAKLALAQIYAGDGKTDEAKKLLQSLIENPTMMVSKAQATVTLAQIIAKQDPAEAQRILEPLLKSTDTGVSSAALSIASQIPK